MINIFLTNLGKYNEGELIGNWYTLPLQDEEMQKAFNEIGLNKQYEEYFITDYEVDIPINIYEYENLERLNELAYKLDEIEKPHLKALLEDSILSIDDLYEKDIYELKEVIERHSYIQLDDTLGNDERKFGEAYIMEFLGGLENLSREDLEYYFDFEKFGRDKLLNGCFISSDNIGVI